MFLETRNISWVINCKNENYAKRRKYVLKVELSAPRIRPVLTASSALLFTSLYGSVPVFTKRCLCTDNNVVYIYMALCGNKNPLFPPPTLTTNSYPSRQEHSPTPAFTRSALHLASTLHVAHSPPCQQSSPCSYSSGQQKMTNGGK